jgi:hypothetical protein
MRNLPKRRGKVTQGAAGCNRGAWPSGHDGVSCRSTAPGKVRDGTCAVRENRAQGLTKFMGRTKMNAINVAWGGHFPKDLYKKSEE